MIIKRETVNSIGRYKLPFYVNIQYEKENKMRFAICEELDIISYGENVKEARNNLEFELEKAIEYSVDSFKESGLDPASFIIKNKLIKIRNYNKKLGEKMNEIKKYKLL